MRARSSSGESSQKLPATNARGLWICSLYFWTHDRRGPGFAWVMVPDSIALYPRRWQPFTHTLLGSSLEALMLSNTVTKP